MRMKWAGNVPYTRKEMHAGYLWESQMEIDYLEDLDIDRKIILKLT
jgi:hypothetical protein